MARTWGWQCGWEAAFPRRIWPQAGLPPLTPQRAFTSVGQDIWRLAGVNNTNPRTGTARTGQYYVNIAPLGAGAGIQFVGQYVVRTNDWVFWHVPFRLNSWGVPGNLSSADEYVYARCTNLFAAGGGANQYFGIGFLTSPAPVTDIAPAVHLFDGNTGAFLVGSVLAGGGPFTPGPAWITATVAHNIADPAVPLKSTYLYVNGALVAGPYVPFPAVQNDMPILPDNRFTAGKGTDALPDLDIDDWGGAQGGIQVDVPGANHGVLLAQPNADVLTGWTPHGPTNRHYHNWDAENRSAGCWGCNYNDPTGIGQQEACDFAPLALGVEPPALVEAARFVWACSGGLGPGPSTHTPFGSIGGAGWRPLTGGVGYHSTGGIGAPPHCFDGPARWHGAQMEYQPVAAPGTAWNMAALNQLQGRLDATVAVNGGVEEFYAMAMTGDVAPRPMPAPNACPIAEWSAARQVGGEQPYLVKPAMVPYHHH